jgi:hypothetical protein
MSEEEEHKIWRGKLSRCPLLNHSVPLRPPRDVPFLLLPSLGIELETRIWLRLRRSAGLRGLRANYFPLAKMILYPIVNGSVKSTRSSTG